MLAKVWGPLIGPLVAMLSFVCSIGNVPLAAVLWNGGISFGGVIAFIFADLIVLPILNIYRKYYGRRMSLYLFATFYLTMAAAGLIVEALFGLLGLVPTTRNASVIDAICQLELHDVPQHRLSGARRRAGRAVPPDGRYPDAQDDGRPASAGDGGDPVIERRRLRLSDAPGGSRWGVGPMPEMRDVARASEVTAHGWFDRSIRPTA